MAAKSISFGGKSFKVSKDKLRLAPVVLNGTSQGGTNAHPWANPIETLFESWAKSQDLADFFKDTSKKKSVHQRALKLGELIDLVEQSWDPVNQSVDVGAWKTLLGETREIEGSAFSCVELEDIAFKTREHYALVSVASGFDWSARGINLYPLMSDLGYMDLLPDGCAEAWHTTVLICLWCVYEAFGLGGLNDTALQWHTWMRDYGRSGKVKEEHLDEEQLIEYKLLGAEKFLRKYWMELLTEEGIRPELVNSDPVWKNVLFLVTGREIVSKLAKGEDLNEYLRKYSFGDLAPKDIQFLVLAAAAQRGAAKGKLSLQEGDDYEDPAGLVGALKGSEFQDYWNKLSGVKYPSVGTQMLLDVFQIVEDWSVIRSGIIAADSAF